ncbi:ZW10 interactor isoform X1 [Gracilinanus agilis]|uniref:ZW10 interactor isoform X1 n=1 Tax=Gracilinanus agilis TaxID=191870 RepID=UPI001CFE1926|nr:ZW10 interactor isoform X1 [Gracilinanus agilis]
MAAEVIARAAAAAEALASAAAALEAPGVQEDVSPALLAEFLKDSRKKEKLLWGQLQVVDALQSFLEHMDGAGNPEEAIRAEVSAAQQLWKDLKAEYLKQTEAVEAALLRALMQLESGQRKQLLLRSTLQQIQTKGQALEERRSVAQAWRRQEQVRAGWSRKGGWGAWEGTGSMALTLSSQEKRRRELVARAQAQRERLENSGQQQEQVLMLQGQETQHAQRLDAFLGLMEMLHGAGGSAEN